MEKIDLYPGGFPARFGRATGGIVSVETRAAKSDGVHGSADIDILDAGAYLRFPVGDNGAFAVAGRRSYLDIMLSFFLPEQSPGTRLLVVPVYEDYQLRFDYDLKEHGKLSFFLIGSSDTLEVLSEDEEMDSSLNLSASISFLRFIASYKRMLTDNLQLTISQSIGNDSIGAAGSQLEDAPAFSSFNISQDTLGYRMRINGELSSSVYLDTGIDIDSRVTKYDLLVPLNDDIRTFGATDIDPEELLINTHQLSFGIHADVAWDINSKLRLIPGLRGDFYLLDGKKRHSFDPRLVSRYAIDNKWTVKGYLGLFHKAPAPEGFNTEYGNPNLELERALQLGVGGEWKPTPNWLIDGELYFIDRTNLAKFTPEATVDENAEQVDRLFFANTGVGDTVGFELMVKRKVTQKLYGWLSYTYSVSRERNSPEKEYRPTAFDQHHTLNAVASYRTESGWELGSRFRLSTGRPRTPVIGSTFNADTSRYGQVQGDERSARAKTFNQLDIRAEKTWLFNTWLLGIYVDVQNVLNTENEEGIQYDYRFRNSSPITSIPFLPTLGVRGQW